MSMLPKHIHSALTRLNRDKTPKNWDKRTHDSAPHKPFLLLSIIDGIELGWISSPRIELSDELVETFNMYWNGIMGEHRKTTIANPFFHLKKEPFWELQYMVDVAPFSNTPSVQQIRDKIKYAEIDSSLFKAMIDPTSRDEIRRLLLATYFSPETAGRVSDLISFHYEADQCISWLDSLTNEPFIVDHTNLKPHNYRNVSEKVRGAAFSRIVRQAYNYTCAICRSRLIGPDGQSLVEAAHILPFSKYRNDDPRNGISLCRNHHWMFDRHMIGIDKEYCIWVSKHVFEGNNHLEETMKWGGQGMLIPEDERFSPVIEVFEYFSNQ